MNTTTTPATCAKPHFCDGCPLRLEPNPTPMGTMAPIFVAGLALGCIVTSLVLSWAVALH